MTNTINANTIAVPDTIVQNWQGIINMMADIMDVPAGLIMRLVETDIEVFLASHNKDNPYRPGHKENLFGSGLYCETVIKKKAKLLVPNALSDEKWKSNPDITLNMISYLGYPLLFPDGEPFGTICVLDNKENIYAKKYQELIERLREIVQGHLELLYMNRLLGEENQAFSDYISEIRMLRGLLPICANCKKIRDEKGFWNKIENYISEHSNADFTHSICPECTKKLYPELHEDK